MRTSKPISTISYNSVEFLTEKLNELYRNHKISDWMFITHQAEQDEKKAHHHVLIVPNGLIDSMDVQEFMRELDINNPTKPLGCIDFRVTNDMDEWILYCLHLEAYLLTKGETREYHYTKDDFHFCDEDTFENNYLHALKGSKWAKNNQVLQLITDGNISPYELISSGLIPFNQACALSATMKLKKDHILYRNGHENHENNIFTELPETDIVDPETGEAMFPVVKVDKLPFTDTDTDE